MSTGVAVVLVTVPDEAQAAALATTLLDEGLIACANLVPGVRSLYRWEGRLCDEREVLVVMKAPRTGLSRLTDRVVALHPAQVPEVLALDVVDGHQPYLDWVLRAPVLSG